MDEIFDVLVVGGGQTGLALGYYLTRQRKRVVILDARKRVGDFWRERWDSLRLFTPRQINGLPSLAFPRGPEQFPAKDELADYLEMYAEPFRLPVRLNSAVTRVVKRDGIFEADVAQDLYRTRRLIVATGAFQSPAIPEFASWLPPHIFQIHS